MNLLLIEWEDAQSASCEWVSAEDYDKVTPAICRSVGWVAYEDEDRITLVSSIVKTTEEDVLYSCDVTIPKGAIIHTEVL